MEVTAFQEKKGKSIQSELELGILKFSSGTFSKAFAKKSPSYSSPVLPLKDIPLGQLLLLSSLRCRHLLLAYKDVFISKRKNLSVLSLLKN